jgi:hypothetical protein
MSEDPGQVRQDEQDESAEPQDAPEAAGTDEDEAEVSGHPS